MLHRLTQAILRDRLTAEQAAATRACTEAIPAAGPATRSSHHLAAVGELMPHLLAATGSRDLRWMACGRVRVPAGPWRYPRRRMALPRTCASTGATDSATTTRTRWRPPATWPGRCGTWARYAEARELDEDTLARQRRVLGDDHPNTLTSAGNLAADLHALKEPDKS